MSTPQPAVTSAEDFVADWVQKSAQEWAEFLFPGVQILLIALVAWFIQRMLTRGFTSLAERYHMPPSMLLPLRGAIRWVIVGSAFMFILERLGVSATSLWTALTGFVAVAAIAFFAAWSVLSNLLCSALIFTVGPFRIGDNVELLDAADKPGVRGRVISINTLYTTLEDTSPENQGALLQIPNNMFFQKILRRWRNANGPKPLPETDEKH